MNYLKTNIIKKLLLFLLFVPLVSFGQIDYYVSVKVGLPPFKTARKSFETYALQLQISADIRYKLLGHATEGVKQNYQDWQWDKLQNQIHDAHEEVLADFHIDSLYPSLINKADEILKKMGIPPKVFNKKWKCEKI